MYSVGLYARAGARDRQGPGLARARRPAARVLARRDEEIRRQDAWAKTFGLAMEIVSPQEAQELFPLMSTDGVRSAAFLP